jgi:hypothetical protein
MAEGTNGWETWAKRVLGDIERLEKSCTELYKARNDTNIEIAILKTKAAFAGAIWGAGVSLFITVVGGLIIYSIVSHIKG